MLPEVAGLMSAPQVASTAAFIAEIQEPSGSIPWEPGRHADPWNHVEAAMGLDVGGLHVPAQRAYEWLRQTQRADGSWAAAYTNGRPSDLTTDVNFSAYIATGCWHHFLATQDDAFLRDTWSAVDRAMEFTLSMQASGGEIWWARDAAGNAWPGALLTSSSSVYLSLRCALAVADQLGHERPAWERAAAALAEAVRCRPEAFEPKPTYAMDWYYPVLTGIVQGRSAEARLAARWADFVVPGSGVRCVSDRPWVTVAETSELVLALDSLGLESEARRLFGWISSLRAGSGGYWTGVTFPDGRRWPVEQPTWTAAAVLLAADALAGANPTSGLFRGESFAVDDLEAVG